MEYVNNGKDFQQTSNAMKYMLIPGSRDINSQSASSLPPIENLLLLVTRNVGVMFRLSCDQ